MYRIMRHNDSIKRGNMFLNKYFKLHQQCFGPIEFHRWVPPSIWRIVPVVYSGESANPTISINNATPKMTIINKTIRYFSSEGFTRGNTIIRKGLNNIWRIDGQCNSSVALLVGVMINLAFCLKEKFEFFKMDFICTLQTNRQNVNCSAMGPLMHTSISHDKTNPIS